MNQGISDRCANKFSAFKGLEMPSSYDTWVKLGIVLIHWNEQEFLEINRTRLGLEMLINGLVKLLMKVGELFWQQNPKDKTTEYLTNIGSDTRRNFRVKNMYIGKQKQQHEENSMNWNICEIYRGINEFRNVSHTCPYVIVHLQQMHLAF